MPENPASAGLRAARISSGRSQSQAARELAALAAADGVPAASAASLKTLLSRWENGHVLPEPQYRTLLGRLYGRSPAELGIAGPAETAAGSATARWVGAVAAAAAVDGPAMGLWWEQADLARRLDDELGVTGAGELVRAQVERLDETLTHALTGTARAGVAAVLTGVAALAGAQALDDGRHDDAWRRYHRARTAACEADLPGAHAVAVAGQAAVLLDAGEVAAAGSLLADAGAGPPGPAEVRLAAALGLVRAAAGDATAARGALATAERGLRGARADLAAPRGHPAVELTDVHRWRGRALVTLGDADAVEPLQRALAAGPRSARHRAALHADLALALAPDRPEQAADHARSARDLARRIGSRRISARLAGFGPHQGRAR